MHVFTLYHISYTNFPPLFLGFFISPEAALVPAAIMAEEVRQGRFQLKENHSCSDATSKIIFLCTHISKIHSSGAFPVYLSTTQHTQKISVRFYLCEWFVFFKKCTVGVMNNNYFLYHCMHSQLSPILLSSAVDGSSTYISCLALASCPITYPPALGSVAYGFSVSSLSY